MHPLLQAACWSWLALCLIVDIILYRRTRNRRIRAIPALVKTIGSVLCFVVNGSLSTPPMVDEKYSLLVVIGLLLMMAVLIDVWAWLFSDGFPTKRKMKIYACGIALCLVAALVYGLLFDNNFYRHTSSGSMEHYSFHAHTGECASTLKLYEDEPDCRITFDAEEGTLDLLVTDETGNILYSGTPEDPSEFIITTTGNIRITITTEAFTGKLHADRIEANDLK